MGRPALRAVASRDPLRAALADAIERLADSRAAFAEASQAETRLTDQVMASYAELSDIEDEIKRAGAGQRDEIMASVMRGDATPGNGKLAEAEMRKVDAEARRDATNEALDLVRETLRERAAKVKLFEDSVGDARAAVLWEALPDIVAAARPVRMQLAKLASVVSLIGQGQPVGMSYNDPRRAVMDEARRILAPILSDAAALPPADISAWRAAVEGLRTDPDAPLPTEA